MSIEIEFAHSTVLISGGSSGIGLGIARCFLEAGATVHVTGTRSSAADYEHATELEGIHYHSLDVCDEASTAALIESLDALDVLVCCAGSVAYGRKEYTLETFKEIIDINLNGVMNLCTASHDKLKQSEQSSVVVIGSTSSFIATPGQPAYSSSKGALVTLTKSLASAWARDGIRVNGIAPGFVATKLTERSRSDEGIYEASLQRIPLKRWGEAAEIGNATLFMASPLASYVTGQMLLVDGGITLM